MKLDDIKSKIENIKKFREENKNNQKDEFPFTEINRDLLKNFRKSILYIKYKDNSTGESEGIQNLKIINKNNEVDNKMLNTGNPLLGRINGGIDATKQEKFVEANNDPDFNKLFNIENYKKNNVRSSSNEKQQVFRKELFNILNYKDFV
jgi:hypothetical protein